MARIGTGDMVMTSLLSRHSQSLRAELQSRMQEVASGLKCDLTSAVGGDYSDLAALDHSLQRLQGYAANTTEAGLFVDVVQGALELVSSSADTLASRALQAAGMDKSGEFGILTIEARRTFDTALATLNTQFSGRAVFAGVNSDTAPLPDSATIFAALDIATASATTAADALTAINDWFMGATGLELAYAGGAPRSPATIAPGETADMSVTALDPALRAALRDMATLAMLGRGLMAGQPDERIELARTAGEGLLSGGTARADLMARVGSTQQQIADVAIRNSAEKSALEIAHAHIVKADPFEAASRLEELQTQLEALYVITARISRLSLSEYI